MTIHYDLPAADYHAAPLLTSGALRDFIRSPRLYRDRMDGLLPEKDSDALRFGTLFHMAVLEPGKYDQAVAVKPEGMSFASKEGKAWKEDHAGREIISCADSARIDCMRTRMPEEVAAMLVSGKSEVTVRNKLGGFDAQCRADHWDAPGRMLYDLKTIGAIEKAEREIYARGYHIQGQFYRRLIEAETGTMPTLRLIFAESAPPYRWRVVQLDVDFQMIADQAIDDALAELAECERADKWEDRDDLHLVASPPSWLNDDTNEDEE